MWQFAPAPSVMLMASTRSRKREARAISTSGSLESGGETSTVVTKRPDWQACSKPKLSRAGTAVGRMAVGYACAAIDHPQPGRTVPKAVIDRFEKRLVARRADPLHAVGRLDPDTAHARIDLAGAVGAHAAARTVAHLLGAIGRAGHAGRGQHALAAHLAIDQQTASLHVRLETEGVPRAAGLPTSQNGSDVEQTVRRRHRRA